MVPKQTFSAAIVPNSRSLLYSSIRSDSLLCHSPVHFPLRMPQTHVLIMSVVTNTAPITGGVNIHVCPCAVCTHICMLLLLFRGQSLITVAYSLLVQATCLVIAVQVIHGLTCTLSLLCTNTAYDSIFKTIARVYSVGKSIHLSLKDECPWESGWPHYWRVH